MANSGANQIIPTDFKSLFWDTNIDQLDLQRHQSLIVERILNYGDEDAYRWMFKTYADEIIISVVKSNRRINKKAAVMMANFYNIPREDLACMKNVSVLHSTIEFRSCPLADYRDIAAMKLIAAAQRGSKKDFVDLNYLMKQGMTTELCREALQVKYAGVRWCWPVVVKGLAYFDDAELEPMPVMKVSREAARPLSETEWQNIKQDLTALQVELLQSIRC